MPHTTRTVDPWFLGIVCALVGIGFLIFTSASMGLLTREGTLFSAIAGKQLLAALLGIALAYGLSRIPYRGLRRYTFPLFIFAILLAVLVFIPGVGITHAGASRWILIFGYSFQPSELLKIAVVLYYATFLAEFKDRVQSFILGLLPLGLLLILTAGLLLTQPDTDTFLIIFVTLTSMFLAAGGRWKHILILLLIGMIGLAGLIYTRPYLKERVMTFLKPAEADARGARYQLDQSLIAIGSGGWFGRGFGQSVQKFSYLPEPIGDSIFAVAAEEFGFVGGMLLIGLFLGFIFRGLRIATHSPDLFGGLLSLGIVILIGTGAFINMASMLGLMPLSGLTLAFVSHGGTALLITLAATGIVLGVSRFQRN